MLMEAVSPKIPINRIPASRINDVDFDNLPFGRVFSDHMMVADYADGIWQNPRIEPYDRISIAPCITSLHYGQAIFEGMKAFVNDKEKHSFSVLLITTVDLMNPQSGCACQKFLKRYSWMGCFN